jgi:hypothetical protein
MHTAQCPLVIAYMDSSRFASNCIFDQPEYDCTRISGFYTGILFPRAMMNVRPCVANRPSGLVSRGPMQ